MKLTDLHATFICWYERPPSAEERTLNPSWPADKLLDCFRHVGTLQEAHGLLFVCPKGKAAGDEHHIEVFFEGSPVPARLGQNRAGRAVRWRASGTGLHDLTLTPSIQEESGPCGWHGFVTSGEAV